MRRTSIALTAAAATLAAGLLTGSLASGTEKLAEQEKLGCAACHDKPGSKLLTDRGKYYETMRTFEGYEDLESSFGRCTACHDTKPGSKKLTRQGKQFQELVVDMEGLRAWMQEHHPTPPPQGDPKEDPEP